MEALGMDVIPTYAGTSAGEDFVEETAPPAGHHFMADESRLEQGVRRTEQRLHSESSTNERKDRKLW